MPHTGYDVGWCPLDRRVPESETKTQGTTVNNQASVWREQESAQSKELQFHTAGVVGQIGGAPDYRRSSTLHRVCIKSA